MMEQLPVWYNGKKTVVGGVTEFTTCQEIVIALAQFTRVTGRFNLIDRTVIQERVLHPKERILHTISKWGQSSQNYLVLRKKSDTPGSSRPSSAGSNSSPKRAKPFLVTGAITLPEHDSSLPSSSDELTLPQKVSSKERKIAPTSTKKKPPVILPKPSRRTAKEEEVTPRDIGREEAASIRVVEPMTRTAPKPAPRKRNSIDAERVLEDFQKDLNGDNALSLSPESGVWGVDGDDEEREKLIEDVYKRALEEEVMKGKIGGEGRMKDMDSERNRAAHLERALQEKRKKEREEKDRQRLAKDPGKMREFERKKREMEERRKKAEETKRLEEERRQKEEREKRYLEERRRQEAEEKQRELEERRKEEDEVKRKVEEERMRIEEERRRLEEERRRSEEAKKKKELQEKERQRREVEVKRKQEEDARRALEEQNSREQEEVDRRKILLEQQRKEKEITEQKRREEELRRKREEEARRKREEEARRKRENESRKKKEMDDRVRNEEEERKKLAKKRELEEIVAVQNGRIETQKVKLSGLDEIIQELLKFESDPDMEKLEEAILETERCIEKNKALLNETEFWENELDLERQMHKKLESNMVELKDKVALCERQISQKQDKIMKLSLKVNHVEDHCFESNDKEADFRAVREELVVLMEEHEGIKSSLDIVNKNLLELDEAFQKKQRELKVLEVEVDEANKEVGSAFKEVKASNKEVESAFKEVKASRPKSTSPVPQRVLKGSPRQLALAAPSTDNPEGIFL